MTTQLQLIIIIIIIIIIISGHPIGTVLQEPGTCFTLKCVADRLNKNVDTQLQIHDV